jgi:hypothetical protein
VAAHKITAYQLAWSFNPRMGGFVKFQTNENGWSNPIRLATSEEVAAIGIILDSDEGAWFDTRLGGLVAAKQSPRTQGSLSRAMTVLEGGDGPFPTRKSRARRRGSKTTVS